MIRKSFVLNVYPGQEDEYARRHQPIWDDLATVLKEHGVHNYSIFLHPGTRQLFGYVELEDEARWAAIARTESASAGGNSWATSCRPTRTAARPVATLVEVFHLD